MSDEEFKKKMEEQGIMSYEIKIPINNDVEKLCFKCCKEILKCECGD